MWPLHNLESPKTSLPPDAISYAWLSACFFRFTAPFEKRKKKNLELLLEKSTGGTK